MEIIGVRKSEENVKIKNIVNVRFDMVVRIAVVVCVKDERVFFSR